MDNSGGKKRPTINLKLFSSLSEPLSSPNPAKSPRNFEDGVVGLGIVAAMTDPGNTQAAICFARPPRSSPIAIVSSSKAAANFKGGSGLNSDIFGELSENYTCVFSHLGDNLIKKQVYFGDDDKNSRVFTACCSPKRTNIVQAEREFWGDDFLSYCHLCKKELQGLDIYMYRGEKAFCSAECRDKHIRSDDQKEICRTEARKQVECSVSPCSGPQVFFTVVAAA